MSFGSKSIAALKLWWEKPSVDHPRKRRATLGRSSAVLATLVVTAMTAFGLTSTAFAPAGVSAAQSGSPHHPSNAVLTSTCELVGGAGPKVNGTLATTNGVTLGVVHAKADPTTVEKCRPALSVGEASSTTFAYFTPAAFEDVGVTIDAQIVNSPYSFHGYFKTPYIGQHQSTCEIRNSSGQVVNGYPNNPYFCTMVEQNGGVEGWWNPYPKFTVGLRPKVMVTDPTKKAQLATQYAPLCQTGSSACAYVAHSREFFYAENKRISTWFNNCSETEKVSPEETWERTTTIENSFNFKVSVETGKVLELFAKTSAEHQYNHKWAESYKYSFRLALPVPPRKQGAWFYAAGYDRIVGDFTFYDPQGEGTIYVVPNATVDLPNELGKRSNVYHDYDAKLCQGGGSQGGVQRLAEESSHKTLPS